MLAISMTPQAPHLCDPGSDAGCTSSATTTPTIAAQPISSQHASAARDMLSTIPTADSSGHDKNVRKRPKLSLQTTSLPMTFGKSTTGLSLSFATNSAVSPTVLNTFSNAYDLWPSPSISATSSPKKSGKHFRFPSSHAANNREGVPYQLPLGVKSILRNSPLPSSSMRHSSTSMATGATTRRVYFPAKKQVSYRFPLEEEIKTVRFTARHSDLSDESDSEVSDISESEESSDSSTLQSDSGMSDDETDSHASPQSEKKKRKKNMRSERQIRAAALRDGLKGDDYDLASPQTPRQSRRKRLCKWRWTLGPLETSDTAIIPSSLDEQNTHTASPVPAPSSKTGEVNVASIQ
ncbi:hypothetical protein M432DRAFT_116107 [Thermoascus aurantiacus ATCC 26904]